MDYRIESPSRHYLVFLQTFVSELTHELFHYIEKKIKTQQSTNSRHTVSKCMNV